MSVKIFPTISLSRGIVNFPSPGAKKELCQVLLNITCLGPSMTSMEPFLASAKNRCSVSLRLLVRFCNWRNECNANCISNLIAGWTIPCSDEFWLHFLRILTTFIDQRKYDTCVQWIHPIFFFSFISFYSRISQLKVSSLSVQLYVKINCTSKYVYIYTIYTCYIPWSIAEKQCHAISKPGPCFSQFLS